SCSTDGENWKEVGTVFVPEANKEMDAGVFMSAANGSGDSKGLAQFQDFSIAPQEFLLQLPNRKVPAGTHVNVTASFQNEKEQSVQDLAAELNVPDNWEAEAITPTDEIDVAPKEKVKV